MSFWSNRFAWQPRKSVAQRRAEAAREIADAARSGRAKSPVTVAGRKIASTFWGQAWCDNLERYRDFAYRLERGRSYLRSGSVIDLRIAGGKVAAEVLGSELYDVVIEIDAVQRAAWQAIQRDCAGAIGSRLELLSGRLSEPVMARLCAERTGLFPAPSAIRFTCSCPDHASMCKHVAATMYGVGARLDHAPDMLFTLRCVSLDELLASAVSELPAAPAAGRVLASDGLASLFGIELAEPAAPASPPRSARRTRVRPASARASVREPAATARRVAAKPTRRNSAEATRIASAPSRSTPAAPRGTAPPSTGTKAASASTKATSTSTKARSTSTKATSTGTKAVRLARRRR
jgi:uncharacterized Zn finger protein